MKDLKKDFAPSAIGASPVKGCSLSPDWSLAEAQGRVGNRATVGAWTLDFSDFLSQKQGKGARQGKAQRDELPAVQAWREGQKPHSMSPRASSSNAVHCLPNQLSKFLSFSGFSEILVQSRGQAYVWHTPLSQAMYFCDETISESSFT